jgi:DNA repair ATPase RecN
MLIELRIKNFAVIQVLSLQVERRSCVGALIYSSA